MIPQNWRNQFLESFCQANWQSIIKHFRWNAIISIFQFIILTPSFIREGKGSKGNSQRPNKRKINQLSGDNPLGVERRGTTLAQIQNISENESNRRDLGYSTAYPTGQPPHSQHPFIHLISLQRSSNSKNENWWKSKVNAQYLAFQPSFMSSPTPIW